MDPEFIKEVELKKAKTNRRWARQQEVIDTISFLLLTQDKLASENILNSLKNKNVTIDGQDIVLGTIALGQWSAYSRNSTPTPVGGQGQLSGGAITGIVIICIVGVLVIILFVAAICSIATRRKKSATYEFELHKATAGGKAVPISEKEVS